MNWNLDSYFPEFNGPEMVAFRQKLEEDLAAPLEHASGLPPLEPSSADHWESVFLADEALTSRFSHLGSYLGCLTAADAANEDYRREEAALSRLGGPKGPK